MIRQSFVASVLPLLFFSFFIRWFIHCPLLTPCAFALLKYIYMYFIERDRIVAARVGQSCGFESFLLSAYNINVLLSSWSSSSFRWIKPDRTEIECIQSGRRKQYIRPSYRFCSSRRLEGRARALQTLPQTFLIRFNTNDRRGEIAITITIAHGALHQQ